jgi:hypothetical protein
MSKPLLASKKVEENTKEKDAEGDERQASEMNEMNEL